MAGRCRQGTTAEDHLIAHEFAVVLADRASHRAEAWVREKGADRPPRTQFRSEAARRTCGRRRPPDIMRCGQPARLDRVRSGPRSQNLPTVILFVPMHRGLPTFGLHGRPGVTHPQCHGAVAGTFHEIEPFAAAHQPIRGPVGPAEGLVSRVLSVLACGPRLGRSSATCGRYGEPPQQSVRSRRGRWSCPTYMR